MKARLKSMPTSPLRVVLQHLLADLRPDGDGVTDGELLARFLGSRDEDALAALVRRHAPMVWGVCRRLLGHHDAEDAFQATFLVLVRKARDVPRQTVANWLYGVGRQTAVRLQATAARRGRREMQVASMPEPTVPEVRDADLRAVLDEELSRLPEHYRGVIVLCDLEGMTRKEAARQLGIPEGSVASRLARARALLAKRLTQRGFVFSSGSVAAVLSAEWGSASAPPALVASTIKAASLLAAGRAAGVVSVKVAALTEGVMNAMFVNKLVKVTAVLLVIAAVVGSGGLLCRTRAADSGKQGARAAAPQPEPGRIAQTEKKPRADKTQEGLKQLVEEAKAEVLLAEAQLDVARVKLGRLTQTHEAAKRARKDKAKKPAAGTKIQGEAALPAADAREGVLRAELEKVDAKARVVTVMCKGTFSGAGDPDKGGLGRFENNLRLENLPVAKAARILINGKPGKLADLKVGRPVSLRLAVKGGGITVQEIAAPGKDMPPGATGRTIKRE